MKRLGQAAGIFLGTIVCTAGFYDPASSVDLVSIEYSISHPGNAVGLEKRYMVIGNAVVLETFQQTESGQQRSKHCSKLDKSERDTLEANVRQIIRLKWRSPKVFKQFGEAGYPYHGQMDIIEIAYKWHDNNEKVTARFSTEESEFGTQTFSVPEVYLVLRQLSGLKNHRFDECQDANIG